MGLCLQHYRNSICDGSSSPLWRTTPQPNDCRSRYELQFCIRCPQRPKIKTLESITIKEKFFMKKEYNLEGIKCAGCANTVKERFSNVPGVTNVEVSLENKVATVEGDASVDALQASLEGTKYSIKK